VAVRSVRDVLEDALGRGDERARLVSDAEDRGLVVETAPAEGFDGMNSDRAVPDPDFITQLLRIAAADDELDPGELEFAVITGGTSVAVVRGELVRNQPVKYWPFDKGEIIVLPKDGYREPFGDGRSVAKWDVSYEQFGHDYEAAKRCSDQVKAEPDRDLFA
jgi:hypothetical protein